MAVPPRRSPRFICLQYNLDHSVPQVHLLCQLRCCCLPCDRSQSKWKIIFHRQLMRPLHEYISRVVYISRIRHIRYVIDKSVPKEGAPDYWYSNRWNPGSPRSNILLVGKTNQYQPYNAVATEERQGPGDESRHIREDVQSTWVSARRHTCVVKKWKEAGEP